MVKKINPDNSKTLYVGGIYEVDKNSGGSVTGTKTYYPAAGAMRVGSTLYYVLKDHLGSSSVVTDNTGLIVGEDRFYPFGETRFTTGTMFTDKLFTGQREITGLGIYHYGARFYSPKLGRFLSADTIVPGYANPQNLNRYSYVTNNPLRYIDPTGHRPEDGYAGTSGCSNPKYCSNGRPKSKQELARMRWEKRNNNGGGGGSTPTPTSTPSPSVTPTSTTTLTATITPACSSPSNMCATIVAGQSTVAAFQTHTPTATTTPYQTPTPFLRNEVNAVADDIFGRPDAGPGLTDLVSWGRYIDGAVGGAHLIGDIVEAAKNEPPMTQQQAQAGLVTTAIAFVTSILPWVLAL